MELTQSEQRVANMARTNAYEQWKTAKTANLETWQELPSFSKRCTVPMNSEGPDQTARMRSLIWASTVRACV